MDSHFSRVFFSLLTITFTIMLDSHLTEAIEYIVGDSDGWSTGKNYLEWSQKYNFTVGDILVFKYVLSQHNVYQVTETTFRSCDTTSGIISMHLSGNDRIELKEPTRYWFVCTTKGHCKGGMRFGITVAESNRGEEPPPSDSGSTQPPPAPVTVPDDAEPHGRGTRWWVGALVVLFGLLYY